MPDNTPIILAFLRHYLPGYKSGGPIRTIANTVEHLADEFDFRIVTSDRDALDSLPYPNIAVDRWNPVGKAQVFYASPHERSMTSFVRLINNTPHDVLYLNSFFDLVFTLKPLLARRLALVAKRPIVLAPRGELSQGAFALKRWKKVPYCALGNAARLFCNLTWQASSPFEALDIELAMGPIADDIVVAPNLPPLPGKALCGKTAEPKQNHGALRVCFLSRITPTKNLDFAIRVLEKVCVPVEFTIVGPVRDERYWARCRSLIGRIPHHVKVKTLSGVEHAEVGPTLAEHDLLFLPTRGENYGHVILEALAAGTPVLIANTTPWRGLADAGVGWDLPLEDEQAFVEAIEHAAGMDPRAYSAWRQRVRRYARVRMMDPEVADANRRLFREVRDRRVSG
jgi:glycosyltransferase involved in cell wall biosynthesis